MHDLLVSVPLALAALAAILAACELFTNAVEWLGRKLHVGAGVVGSVFAAVGTALPETIVPLVALLWGTAASHEEIGIGAILGAPFMLATLGFTMNGAASLYFYFRGRRPTADMQVHTDTLAKDFRYFMLTYSFAMFLGWGFPFWMRAIGAAVLASAYAVFVWEHVRGGAEHELGETADLHLCRALCRLTASANPSQPRLRFILVQLVGSLAIMVLGARGFVIGLSHIAEALGISPLVLSVILTPIATELPEKFNSVIWVRAGKDTLALGNISGAMVFQSAIPVSVGLLLTPWRLDAHGIASGLVALFSAGIAQAYMNRYHRLSPWVLVLGLPLYCLWVAIAFSLT